MKMRKMFTLLLAAALAVTMLFPASAFAGTTNAPTPTLDEGTSLKWEKGMLRDGMSWGTMPTPPLLAGGYLYYGSKNQVFKLDPSSGKVLAQSPALNSNFGWAMMPVAVDDVKNPKYVYSFLDYGRFIRLNASDLSKPDGWYESVDEFSLDEMAQNNCYVKYIDGRLYTGTWRGGTYVGEYICIDANTGETIWKVGKMEKNSGFYWTGAAAIDTPEGGRRIVFGGDDGLLYSVAENATQKDFDTSSEKIKTLQLDYGIRTIPAVDQENQTIFVPTNDEKEASSESGKGVFYQIAVNDDGSMQIVGQNTTVGCSKNAPVIYKDHVFVSGYRGHIYAFNKKDISAPEWDVKGPSEMKGEMLVSEYGDRIRIYAAFYSRPGGIFCIETDPECTEHKEDVIYVPAHMEYSISPVVCDENGVIYYKNDSGYLMAIKAGKDTAAVTGFKAVDKTYNKVTLNWDYKSNVKSYDLYQKVGKTNTKIASVSSDSYLKKNATYTLSNLKTGTKYSFTVRAVLRDGTECNATKAIAYTPALNTTKATAKAGKKQITLKWKKVTGATGYTIYRATKKKGTYKAVKTIKKAGTLSYVNKKLKKGKTYYYKVKAYRIVDGKKVYSEFSNIVYKKVK